MAAIPSLNSVLLGWLVFTGLVWLKRAVWVSTLRRRNPTLAPKEFSRSPRPRVSVIVPAKDEEKNIENCLQHLLLQNYDNYEIIVVDDRSGDATPQILETYRRNSKIPLKIVRVEKLPPGWTGKNHAMHVGAKAAAGEWLLFTDADTTHSPLSLSTALDKAVTDGIDFLTLAPETESESFWEHTVQPLAVSSLALWFDPAKVNDPKHPGVLANGQFLLIEKIAYEQVGGSESVKDKVVEDVELAKRFRSGGKLVQFLDGTRLYSTRMYSSLAEIHRGWTRIYIHLFDKKIAPILHKIALFLFFSILPFAVLAAEIYLRQTDSAIYDPLLLKISFGVSAFIVAVRAAGNLRVRSSPWHAFLHPLGSLVLVWILSTCVFRIAAGRPSLWRGDKL
jgi:chlorobactene glucosyltransferase